MAPLYRKLILFEALLQLGDEGEALWRDEADELVVGERFDGLRIEINERESNWNIGDGSAVVYVPPFAKSAKDGAPAPANR